ncbi:MAG: hypothetical protein ACTSW1_17550 [Candidatus Hodarchaeales archaeon]
MSFPRPCYMDMSSFGVGFISCSKKNGSVEGKVVDGWRSVEVWRSRLGETTAYHNVNRLELYLEYLCESEPGFHGFSPDDLVRFQIHASNLDRYLILDTVQRWVDSIPNLRAGSKKGYYSSIRSFFMHNRAELPTDPGYRIRSSKPPVKNRLTVDILKQVVLASKPRYQAIFMIMFQAGLDEASFIHWSMNGLESTLQQLRKKPDGPIMIELPGRKHTKNIENFYTFFGYDGVKLLRNYLEKRGTAPGPIFKVSKKAMIKYWTRQLKRLGYIKQKGSSRGNRYGYNLHRLRSLFRSRWRISGVDVELAEFFMGHEIDKLGYDKSPWLNTEWYEDQYIAAQPWLNILSDDPLKVPVRDVHELRRRLIEKENNENHKITQLEAELQKMKTQHQELFEVMKQLVLKSN